MNKRMLTAALGTVVAMAAVPALAQETKPLGLSARVGLFFPSDGDARDEVPTDNIAEGLVHADAVHIDGDSLRRAQQRGGSKAAIVHVRLERVAVYFIDEHAVHALVERVEEVDGSAFD